MNRSFASPLSLAACLVALLATGPVSAGSPALMDVNSSGTTTFGGTRSTGRFGWAGVGIYHTSVSIDVPVGGGQTASFSAGQTHFGFNAGGALDVLPITPELPLSVFGNIALAFAGDFTIFPITVGAAVHYDKLPVQLLGGLGFTLMPATDIGETPLGVGILLMASYPLPQIRPGAAGMAQFQYHFLDDGFSLWVLDVGVSMTF